MAPTFSSPQLWEVQSKTQSFKASFIHKGSNVILFFSIWGTNFTVCCFLNNKAYNNFSGSVFLAPEKNKTNHSGLVYKNKWERAVKERFDIFVWPSKQHGSLNRQSFTHIHLYVIGFSSFSKRSHYYKHVLLKELSKCKLRWSIGDVPCSPGLFWCLAYSYGYNWPKTKCKHTVWLSVPQNWR